MQIRPQFLVQVRQNKFSMHLRRQPQEVSRFHCFVHKCNEKGFHEGWYIVHDRVQPKLIKEKDKSKTIY